MIEFKGVSKGFGDRLLIDDLSFIVPPGAIVGIIGPNGAGKSTLFKMINGVEQPDAGEVVIGKSVKLAFVDQSRENLSSDKTVFDELSGGRDQITIGRFEMPSRAYIGRFNFKGADQQKIVGALSGGERGRLHLAKTLMTGGNVLLLDEPSNDLDVETLRALEDGLLEYAGSVLVISHDRWFLDRIATHILACEGDSRWSFFTGNYQEYEADKRRRLGEEGAKPRRIRYKPIARVRTPSPLAGGAGRGAERRRVTHVEHVVVRGERAPRAAVPAFTRFTTSSRERSKIASRIPARSSALAWATTNSTRALCWIQRRESSWRRSISMMTSAFERSKRAGSPRRSCSAKNALVHSSW